MGLLSAYIANVRNRRGAELAFAINQREEAEARAKMQQQESARLLHSLTNGSFQQALAAPWSQGGGDGQWAPPISSNSLSSAPPMAPEPQAMGGQKNANQQANLARILERMRTTSQGMQGGKVTRNAALPSPVK